MKSIFDPVVTREIIERLNKVNAGTKPLWGKMNAPQMMKHNQVTVKMALGELILKRTLVGMLFGKLAKKTIMKEEPFKPNLPTAPEFIIKGDPDFEKEKDALINLIKRVTELGPDKIKPAPHTFFGPLSSKEWDHLMYKHLDHHLRQFGF